MCALKPIIEHCAGAHCASLRYENRAIRKDTAHIHFPFSILHFQLLSRRRKNHPRKSRVVFYLSHCSVSSHERGQLLNPLQRERRERHRLHGDRHQLHRVIVSRCAVGMQYTAASAAMNHCPLTVFANPDTDGVHDAAAVSGTVARLMGIPPEKSIFSSFGEVVYGFSRPPGQLTESNSPYFFKKQSSFNYLSLSASFTLSQKLLRLT